MWRPKLLNIEKLEDRICRQIQDLHASFGTKERRKHTGCSQLFLLQGVEIELIFALPCVYGPQFLRYFHDFLNLLFSLYWQPFARYEPTFKISMFGHEIFNLKKRPKVAYVLSFYRRGSKLSLFFLYGQPFLRYESISKLPYLGMKSGI